jgi:hypothetical protein
LPRHRLQHQTLLVVLLAEHRGMRLHHVEELQHDGGNTAKVPRTHGTFQDVLNAGRLHGVGLRFRVELLFVRCKDHVAVDTFQLPAVIRQRARVAVKVLAGPELKAVHKDADDGAGTARRGFLNQAQMALVQIAHGRHEHVVRHALQILAQFGYGVNDFHRDLL